MFAANKNHALTPHEAPPSTHRVHLGIRLTKRLIDSGGALVGLALLAPILPFIALAIYVDSPGPIFYRQKRAGSLRGVGRVRGRRSVEFEEFWMTKFRTMHPDADSYPAGVVTAKNDPRVTRVGRFLRKTRLDELPQLWDVLRGAMSLVGPRPERPELLRNLASAIPLFEERMRGVKPGITGLAQVSLGYQGDIPPGSVLEPVQKALKNPFSLPEADGSLADDMRMKMLFDVAYVVSQESYIAFIAMEAKIIVRTPLVMFLGVGR